MRELSEIQQIRLTETYYHERLMAAKKINPPLNSPVFRAFQEIEIRYLEAHSCICYIDLLKECLDDPDVITDVSLLIFELFEKSVNGVSDDYTTAIKRAEVIDDTKSKFIDAVEVFTMYQKTTNDQFFSNLIHLIYTGLFFWLQVREQIKPVNETRKAAAS